MTEGNFKLYVPISEKVSSMRDSRKIGTDDISEQRAYELLADHNFRLILEKQKDFFRNPYLLEVISPPGLTKKEGAETEIFPGPLNVSLITQLAFFVNYFAEKLKKVGTNEALAINEYNKKEAIERLLSRSDFGTGMGLASQIIKALDIYDASSHPSEGLDSINEMYHSDPISVIDKVVSFNLPRFNRNHKETRETEKKYVPELVAAGLKHGASLLRIGYNSLSANRREE